MFVWTYQSLNHFIFYKLFLGNKAFFTNQISAESLSSSHLGLTDEAKVTVAVAVVEQLFDATCRQMDLTAVLLAITIDPVVGLTFIPVAVKNPEEQNKWETQLTVDDQVEATFLLLYS